MFASSGNMTMLKGLGIGLAVGAVATGMAALTSSRMMSRKSKRICKRNAAKCMKTVEGMINGISSMAR